MTPRVQKSPYEYSPHIYVFQDICNVYILKNKKEAVLIDFGSGAVLEHLPDIGVERVYAILHTHHHRDQCQGDYKAVKKGIPIFVPSHERRLFDQVELYWATKQLWDMYDVRNTFFTLTESVPVNGVLKDFQTWVWKGLEFFVLPTPGHTVGSISLICEIDEKKIAFVGDLLHSPGKVLTLYDLQYNYSETDGLEAEILSLRNLMRRTPEVLFSSHGKPMNDADEALSLTKENLTKYFSLRNNGLLPVNEQDFTQVTAHLLAAEYACSHFYVILSGDGHALLIDYGAPNLALFSPAAIHFEQGETVRFFEHSIHRLMEKYGVRKIDAVIPTHYHDDHVNGIPYLQSQFGVECWAYEKMKNVFEYPQGEQIGCVMPYPIKVDRVLSDGEIVHWRENKLLIRHTPGHTEYAISIFSEIDGKRVGFSGDNLFIRLYRTPSVIYRNHLQKDAHQKTFQIFFEHQPEVICGGHELLTKVEPEMYETLLKKSMQLTRHFESLIPGEVDYGLEPYWAQIYPYQSYGNPGDTINLQCRVKNFNNYDAVVNILPVLPQSWSYAPDDIEIHLDAHSENSIEFKVHIHQDFRFILPRVAIAADVVFNGRSLGQVAEAVVSCKDLQTHTYGGTGMRENKRIK
jgi:glyoxylase-like metal-dependent hydrolase (beta-lactamase superfamily II)